MIAALFLSLLATSRDARLPVGRVGDYAGRVFIRTGTHPKEFRIKASDKKSVIYRGDRVKCIGASSLVLTINNVPVQRFPHHEGGQWETVQSERTPQQRACEEVLFKALAKRKGGSGPVRWPLEDMPVSANDFCVIPSRRMMETFVRVEYLGESFWRGTLAEDSVCGYSSASLSKKLRGAREKGLLTGYRILFAKESVSFKLLDVRADDNLSKNLANAQKCDNEFIQMLVRASCLYQASQYEPAALLVAEARKLDPDDKRLTEILARLQYAGYGR